MFRSLETLVIAMATLPLLALAGPQDEDCQKKLSLAVNNSSRFEHPSIPRLISIEHTETMFRYLREAKLWHMPAVFDRLIDTPLGLRKNYPFKKVRVVLRVWSDDEANFEPGAQPHPGNIDRNILIDLTNPNRVIHLDDSLPAADLTKRFDTSFEEPIQDRFFVENFLPRKAVLGVLKEAAAKFQNNQIIQSNRVSDWEVEGQTTLSIATNDLTSAEFGTILNLLAKYLDDRSKR